ncbi:hypothetical protein AZSI13_11710 [Azospira sp. I13]|uniref:YaeQ family protein n=1 Tax=Azospira sp. I13 TaxID=1765050 RepID=UPI000D43ECBD|nr:YaeQ family protein [Azospira sp. I13]GBG01844.1 hypothetical protein AZSI13_11710 [Azospira sp. I13]
MALKSTVFKADLSVADMDRHHYADYSLTLARHPSETDERMMIRLLAYALYADERLGFCKGLSDDDEPDLWRKDYTEAIEQWIEVGLPDEKRIKKGLSRSAQVVVLAYGGRAAEIWWSQLATKVERQEKLTVLFIPEAQSRALAELADRTMRLSCSIQDGHLMISSDKGTVTVEPVKWLARD